MMKLSYLLLSGFTGFLLYSLLVLVFGPSGIYAHAELAEYRNKLDSNIEELEKINNNLEERFQLLRSSEDHIRMLSREIGYYEADERVITVNGYKAGAKYFTIGKRIPKPGKPENHIPLFRGIALSTALALFLLLSFFKKQSS